MKAHRERPAGGLSNVDWISVGELGAAFASDTHALPESSVLAGRKFRIHFENGAIGDLPADGASYSVTSLRPSVHLVTQTGRGAATESRTLVLDEAAGICTEIRGRLPSRDEASTPAWLRIEEGQELTAVDVALIAGSIDTPFVASTARHEATSELVGSRIEYTYSESERYEHIYLNERFYTWHCLAGSEQGLADTDRCHHLKVAPELYLFVWREKVVPTLGIVLVDLRQRRTTGRIFGYEGFDFDRTVSFAVGAHLRVIAPANR